MKKELAWLEHVGRISSNNVNTDTKLPGHPIWADSPLWEKRHCQGDLELHIQSQGTAQISERSGPTMGG